MAELRQMEAIDLAMIKAAAKTLNDTGLLENKLKIIVKKEDLVDSFLGAVKGLDTAGKEAEIPQPVVDAFNHCHTLATEEEMTKLKEGKIKKGPDPEKAKKVKVQKETALARKTFLIDMIKEATFTRKQIVGAAVEKFPQIAKSTITTEMTDSKNPKYFEKAGFPKLVVANEEGILSFKEE